MPQFGVRVDDALATRLQVEAERRETTVPDLFRIASIELLTNDTEPQRSDQLLIEVLRTRALLARYIIEEKGEETLKELVQESRLDVEAQLTGEA
jgi:hypothetical protein